MPVLQICSLESLAHFKLVCCTARVINPVSCQSCRYNATEVHRQQRAISQAQLTRVLSNFSIFVVVSRIQVRRDTTSPVGRPRTPLVRVDHARRMELNQLHGLVVHLLGALIALPSFLKQRAARQESYTRYRHFNVQHHAGASACGCDQSTGRRACAARGHSQHAVLMSPRPHMTGVCKCKSAVFTCLG